ncbi:MAG: Phage minor structural protein GP20 [Firmicutes bacterium ADurb.Bin193]|nr:MAG: Phage minor structural protein GP20 [Firmicutes bacterium ADurb.Bin193]
MIWLEKILEGIEGGEQIAEKIRSELPRHFIPKDKYNELVQSKKGLEESLKEQMSQRLLDVALSSALASKKGEIRDVDMVKSLVDKSALTVGEDGLVSGLEDQLRSIRKVKPYLFGQDPLSGRTPYAAEGDAPSVTQEQFRRMGYKERITLFREQPDLYRSLTK